MKNKKVLKDEYKILGEFAGIPYCFEYRTKNQKKFSRNLVYYFENNCKLYVTTDNQLVFSTLPLYKNDVLKIKNNNFSRQYGITLKNIQYIRKAGEYKGEPFIHYFTGNELLYIKTLDKQYKNMIYIICTDKRLCKEKM